VTALDEGRCQHIGYTSDYNSYELQIEVESIDLDIPYSLCYFSKGSLPTKAYFIGRK
jgi:hypothetical protein